MRSILTLKHELLNYAYAGNYRLTDRVFATLDPSVNMTQVLIYVNIRCVFSAVRRCCTQIRGCT